MKLRKKLSNDYLRNISKAKCKATHEEGLKILAPNQMLYRIAIALSRVKASNTSENVLNKIHPFIYSLYQTE